MATDTEDAKTTDALGSLYRAAMALNRSGTRSVADMSEVFTQIDNLTLARRVRLHLSTGLVPEIIWITLFAGAGLTVCFALFFGSPNGLAHLAMTAILSIVLAAGLVVIHRARPPIQWSSAHIAGNPRTRARHCGTRIAQSVNSRAQSVENGQNSMENGSKHR
jgi:hypothetical protein